jgi:large subunit ribosomal protein L4
MELAVYNTLGKETGKKVVLSDAVFGVEANDHAIYLDVKQYLANQRQGTHKSKQKNEVAGSTKKLKRQKGTGGARAGSIKSPLFPGGGRVFGPVPRDYSFKLNKKVKDLARRSALSYKAKDNAIAILEDFSFDKAQTKQFVSLLKSLSLNEKKTLLVLPEANKNISLSGRNVAKAKIITASQINTYDVINADQLILVEGAVSKIDSLLTEKQ